MAPSISRRTAIVLGSGATGLATLLVGIAMVPVNWLKRDIEKTLSTQVGLPVRVGEIERESAFSFTPTLRIRRLYIAQPGWAGKGALASADTVQVKVNALAALMGRASPELLSVSGAQFNLVRAADGRENWRSPREGSPDAAISLTTLRSLDAQLRYRDSIEDRSFRVTLKLDPARGFAANGEGLIAGSPVSISAKAPQSDGNAWPFTLAITGDAIDLRARGSMARAFDLSEVKFDASAKANDLKMLDHVIEAGLFGTQPIALTARVERRGNHWKIANLKGSVGSSDISGNATIMSGNGQKTLDAKLHFARLDFEDFASDAGNAAAQIQERTEGLRLIPDTRINIAKVALTKGRVEVRADRLVSPRRPSALTSLQGVLDLDGKLLTVHPLRIGLTEGAVEGTITVDQRDGRATPLVNLSLDLKDSSMRALFGSDGTINAPIDARVRLIGAGDTIRAAVGQSSGTIGVIAGAGSMPEKLAALLGFDIGRGLFAGSDDQASLRCAVVGMDVREGLGTVSTLLVDTSHSRADGRGTMHFPDERMAFVFTGAPKGSSLLRVPGSIMVQGTVREPQVMVPRKVKSFDNILKGVGRAITGKQGAEARDSDCDALRAQILSR